MALAAAGKVSELVSKQVMLVQKPLHVKEKPGLVASPPALQPLQGTHTSAPPMISSGRTPGRSIQSEPVSLSYRRAWVVFIKELLQQHSSREAMTGLCSPGRGFSGSKVNSPGVGRCMTDEPGAIGIGTVHYECYYDRRPPGIKSLYVRDCLLASADTWGLVLEPDEITSYFWSFRQRTR